MHLKLEELHKVAKKTIKEEQALNTFREEIFEAFGPPVMVSSDSVRVAIAANEQLDLFESTGRSLDGHVKTSVLAEAARNKSVHMRKLAARLLPERLAVNLLNDPSSEVRCAAAKRLPYGIVKEAVKRNPADDQLRTIARNKRISEAGVATPAAADEPFDMYGEKPLGAAVKTMDPLKDMPDFWYERMARKLCAEYGNNLEGQWEEILATRIAASHFATSGVRIDREKLLQAIYDCIEEREEAVLGEGSLRSIAARLRKESHLDEAVMPILDENLKNPVSELLEADLSSSEYIERAEQLFTVRKSYLPAGIKKYRLGEGQRAEMQIPMKARLPGPIDSLSEKAMDTYVMHWNHKQSQSGEPFRLSWSPSPDGINMVGFALELK